MLSIVCAFRPETQNDDSPSAPPHLVTLEETTALHSILWIIQSQSPQDKPTRDKILGGTFTKTNEPGTPLFKDASLKELAGQSTTLAITFKAGG